MTVTPKQLRDQAALTGLDAVADMLRAAADQLEALEWRQVLPAGVRCSETGRSLNRLFVAWLMGWPIAPSIYASSATELSLYRARMRCAFLQLGSPPEAPPAQLSLFG